MKRKKQQEWFELDVIYLRTEFEVLRQTQETAIKHVMMIVAKFYKIYQNFRECQNYSHIRVFSDRINYYTILCHIQIGFE